MFPLFALFLRVRSLSRSACSPCPESERVPLVIKFFLIGRSRSEVKLNDVRQIGKHLKSKKPSAQVAVVIPAFNEEESLPSVLLDLAKAPVDRVIVVDNNSDDQTGERAKAGGAELVFCRARGYGSACLRALDHLSLDPPDIVVFIDADGADELADIPKILEPILENRADFVVGSRVRGGAEPGALTLAQRFGNALSCTLLKLLFKVNYSDLGPFRAIRWEQLLMLSMRDPNFGWTVEMQAKAARLNLRAEEVPTAYRRRLAGESKISGDLRASIRAGTKILWTIGRERLRPPPR